MFNIFLLFEFFKLSFLFLLNCVVMVFMIRSFLFDVMFMDDVVEYY